MEDEESQPKQPTNTFLSTSKLKEKVLNHPMYPRLASHLRCAVETGRQHWIPLTYHDYLSITLIFLNEEINWKLCNGQNLFYFV